MGVGFDKWYLKMIGAGIVCAPCLIGMALSKKFMKRHAYYIISFAVACMMSTVFLELLPELMHEAPGKIGKIRLHWVDGMEYAQMSKNTATFICGILFAGLFFAGLMEAFLHMISPHAHGHSHAHGHGHSPHAGHAHGHGHGDSHHDDHSNCNHAEGECEMTEQDEHSDHSHHSHHSHTPGKDEHGCGHHHHAKGMPICPHCGTTQEDDRFPLGGARMCDKCFKRFKADNCQFATPAKPIKCGDHGCNHKGHESGKCGDHVHAEAVRESIDLAKLEEGRGMDGIRAKTTTFGLPTLVVLDLLARSIHHTIDGIVAGVQDADSRSFWGVIMGLACHEIGHSLGGIGLYMNLGVGKKKAVLLVTCTQVVTTFFGTFLGMLLTKWQTDAKLDIYMQPVAIGLMLYIGMVDLLPELSHMVATRRQKLINCCVVIVAILSVAGVGYLMPHSHGSSMGPKNYYQVRQAEQHEHHDHGGGSCGHDHGNDDHDHCCGDEHVADVSFQAKQTVRLAKATIQVINHLKQAKMPDVDKDVQEYVTNYLKDPKGKWMTGHKYTPHFKKYLALEDSSGREDHDNHEHGSADSCQGCDRGSSKSAHRDL